MKNHTPSKFPNSKSHGSIRRDRNRRRRWLDKVVDSSVSRGCKAWLLALSKMSDDHGKGVWGLQTGQAKRLGCTDRTIRTYRKEAEEAGLITTHRSPYDPVIGCRPKTNYYVFCIPKARRKPRPTPYISTGNDLPPEQHPTGVCESFGFKKEQLSVHRQPEKSCNYADRPEATFAVKQIGSLRALLRPIKG